MARNFQRDEPPSRPSRRRSAVESSCSSKSEKRKNECGYLEDSPGASSFTARSRSRSIDDSEVKEEESKHSRCCSTAYEGEGEDLELFSLSGKTTASETEATKSRSPKRRSKDKARKQSQSGMHRSKSHEPVQKSPINAIRRLIARNVKLQKMSLSTSPTASPSTSSRHRRLPALFLNRSEDFEYCPSLSPPLVAFTRKVHFSCDHCNSPSNVECPIVEEVQIRPELTKQEKRDLYWSKKEISLMRRRSVKMAKDAWCADRENILACVSAFYGFTSLKQTIALHDSSNTDSSRSRLAKKLASSRQSAFHYFYHYEALDSVVIGDGGKVDGGRQNTSMDHPGTNREDNPREQQEPTLVSVVSTLRGIERHLTFDIINYQTECIQSVLNVQSQIREEVANGKKWSVEEVEAALSRQSTEATSPARRFARLLGKADASVVGHGKSATKEHQ